MASGGDRDYYVYASDPLHHSVETYLCNEIQGLTFARNKLSQVETRIQELMQEREDLLYEIEMRRDNVEHAQQRIISCKQTIRDRWTEMKRRYNLVDDSFSLFSLLPMEIFVCILKFLTPSDLCKNTMLVNKLWYDVSKSDMVWKRVYKHQWGKMDDSFCGHCATLVLKKDRDKGPKHTANKMVVFGDPMEEDDMMAIDTCSKPHIPWLNAFVHRQRIEDNWNIGRCSVSTLTGHTDWVTCMIVHGKFLFSGSWDSLIKVWDLDTKDCVSTLTGHTAGINDLDISQSGNVFVSASLDCSLRVWETQTHRCKWVLEGHSDQVSFVKFTYKPGHLVSASLDGTLRMWSADTGKCLYVLQGHSSGITALATTDRCAATGATDGTVIVWDLAEGRNIYTLLGHSDRVTSLQFDSTYKRLASSSWDFTVRVWDTSTGSCLHVLTGHVFRVRTLSFVGDTLVTGSWDHTAKMWDINSGVCLRSLDGHSSYVWSIEQSGPRIVTCSWDKSIRIWDKGDGVCLYALEHLSEVLCMKVSSHRLIGASKEIRIWDFAT